eukprot:CAMPEP_0184316434 /NCGR_PEP_ID=MMETSP1049-20130417/90141_1 /TAXON_ID=77928 /ORGANISM="Proteomonas sulcata, Strain CCMP704" /LENGTH=115 /DNA_ID=CAMNT_0026635409 /DNA_START=24 /DNA_END=371 /DNA_ORIENTATION=-
MSRDLFEWGLLNIYENRKRGVKPWADVRVRFGLSNGETAELKASNPITTPVDLPWQNFDAHLIVVGLSFLEGSILTVDTESGRLGIEYPENPSPGGFDPSDCFETKAGTQCKMEL